MDNGPDAPSHVDRNVHVDTVVLLPLLPALVPLLCLIVAHHHRVLGQFLEEAAREGAVDEEVERARRAGQRQEGENCPHAGGRWWCQVCDCRCCGSCSCGSGNGLIVVVVSVSFPRICLNLEYHVKITWAQSTDLDKNNTNNTNNNTPSVPPTPQNDSD